MQFCPNCANVLLVEDSGNLRFFCQTCPYIFNITGKVTRKLDIKQSKPVEDFDKVWDKAEKTDVACPRCNHEQATFLDIPSHVGEKPRRFFRCANQECKNKWSAIATQ